MTVGFDTMVAAHLLNEELPIGLKSLAGRELGVDNWGKGKQLFGIDDEMKKLTPLWGEEGMGRYCAKDTAYSHMLYERQRMELKDEQGVAWLLKFLILPGLEVVVAMGQNGIWLDMGRVDRRERRFRRRREIFRKRLLGFIAEEFRPTASFTNDHFLRRWIFGHPPDGLGLTPITYTPTGLAQVDEKTLAQLQHPAMDVLRDFNKSTKALEFFAQWRRFLGPDGRLHPRYNPTGTVTGRRSCDQPNLMQVPRDPLLRSCLGVPPGWKLFSPDYSMIEVRIAAWLAEETTMLALLAEGKDPYKAVAAEMYEIPVEQVVKVQRQAAKAVVLGFQYGLMGKSLVGYAKNMFGITLSEEQAIDFRNKFFDRYPGYLSWHEHTRKELRKKLFVTSPLGRVRHLTSILSSDFRIRNEAERQGINSPVQGTGGDWLLASMVSILPQLDPTEILVVGDIHDAGLWQIREDVWPKWAYEILRIMEDPPILHQFHLNQTVRMLAEGAIGRHWGESQTVFLDDFSAPGELSAAWLEQNDG